MEKFKTRGVAYTLSKRKTCPVVERYVSAKLLLKVIFRTSNQLKEPDQKILQNNAIAFSS